MVTALAMQTQRLRVGPLGVLLPLYEPVRLVEEICMLDQLSKTAGSSTSVAGVSSELKLYNVDADRTRAMFDEALEVLGVGLTQSVLTSPASSTTTTRSRWN